MPKRPIIPVLLAEISAKGIESAVEHYDVLKTEHAEEYDFSEMQLNILGYQLLEGGRSEDDITIFKLNVKAFPESYNTYDSLGEAYMIAGEKVLAVENYKRSLELNEQVELILDLIHPQSLILKKLCKDLDLDSEIACVIYVHDDQIPIIHFDHKVISKIVELNSEIDVDLYIL